ncbi:uncharacterized protein BDR25DRAFT_310011 [Lindgomyces ingoldianus]|uniref:Uncharacterized protein n=1 Tax=Lindgomyces ingoldianus TaxID=673940 RepID=A0ACB6RD32_9PLEO|nr:uncharacterized protein BDR25DRAFT_310011 [Lindgomyces ingoldianus]KAF2476663.1 hypothetical protein BDR25DRAFT_310011 [Lindgomyces ingoldianus]
MPNQKAFLIPQKLSLPLSLTCHQLLQTSLAPLKVPFQDFSASFPNLKAVLKRIKPINAAGRPKETWCLCVDWLRYRPMKKTYLAMKQVGWGNKEYYDSLVES